MIFSSFNLNGVHYNSGNINEFDKYELRMPNYEIRQFSNAIKNKIFIDNF